MQILGIMKCILKIVATNQESILTNLGRKSIRIVIYIDDCMNWKKDCHKSNNLAKYYITFHFMLTLFSMLFIPFCHVLTPCEILLQGHQHHNIFFKYVLAADK